MKGGTVDFSEALCHVRSGKHVRRALWGTPEYSMIGKWLELATLRDEQGNSEECLVVRFTDGSFQLFSGANWDLCAEDWELV